MAGLRLHQEADNHGRSEYAHKTELPDEKDGRECRLQRQRAHQPFRASGAAAPSLSFSVAALLQSGQGHRRLRHPHSYGEGQSQWPPGCA